ncbi:MAG: hypothetical protein ACRDAW_00475 [Metamycoplasmataceae bacterium]
METSYSKYNPLLIKKSEENKKIHFSLSTVRFSISIILLIVLLLALYFTNIWSSDTLNGLGIDQKTISDIANNIGVSLVLSGTTPVVSLLTLSEFSSSIFNDAMLNSLIVFGFTSIFLLIPIILFKNGTALSISFILLGFIFIIIIVVLFSIGVSSQMNVISPFKKLQTLQAGSPEYTKYATELFNNIMKGII